MKEETGKPRSSIVKTTGGSKLRDQSLFMSDGDFLASKTFFISFGSKNTKNIAKEHNKLQKNVKVSHSSNGLYYQSSPQFGNMHYQTHYEIHTSNLTWTAFIIV